MTKAGTTKWFFFLAVAPAVLPLIACDPQYTPQRAPDMLMSTPSVQQGRPVVPGEASNYQEWLHGEPNLVDDVPWRMSTVSTPDSGNGSAPASAKPASHVTPYASPYTVSGSSASTSTWSTPASSSTSTAAGGVQMQQQYPPYSSR